MVLVTKKELDKLTELEIERELERLEEEQEILKENWKKRKRKKI